MSHFLVLTGTTGFPSLEDRVCALAVEGGGRYTFLLQTKNTPPNLPVGVAHIDYIDMDKLDTLGFDGVIGHCGAGTTFWALGRSLPFLAIVDRDRPDGHQEDLGGWLKKNNYSLVLDGRLPVSADLSKLAEQGFSRFEPEAFDSSIFLKMLGEI